MFFPQNKPPGEDWIPFTLALDDIDSPGGGCTTHLTGLLLYELRDKLLLADYPLLVRLAPGVPWKTRGNAATVIRGWIQGFGYEELLERARLLAVEYSSGRVNEPGKAPGIALYKGTAPWRDRVLRRLYMRGVSELVYGEYIVETAISRGVMLWGGRGRVGAVLALASLSPEDPYTYELIAYRYPENWGRPRCVDHDPIKESCIPSCASNNYDLSTGKLAAAPNGPDPILAGFRGVCIGGLGCYASVLCEEPHFWVLYRSNQHTDIHYGSMLTPRLTPYKSIKITITILDKEKLPGSHILLQGLHPDLGKIIVAVYRETGPMRRLAENLVRGDLVEVMGTVRPYPGLDEGYTLAAEKLRIIKLEEETLRVAPRCPRCGKRMKSMGRGQGYRCPRCGYRDPEAHPIMIHGIRRIVPSIVTPTPSNLRHLVKPPWLGSGPVTPIPHRLLRVDEVFSIREPPPETLELCSDCM